MAEERQKGDALGRHILEVRRDVCNIRDYEPTLSSISLYGLLEAD
jgi:hypothetical protein